MAMFHELTKLLAAPLEDVLLKIYPAPFFRWLYDVGLQNLQETYPNVLPQPDRMQRVGTDRVPKKSDLIVLLLAALKDAALGRQLFAALPQATRDVIAAVTWERRVNLAALEQTLGHTIAAQNPDERRDHYEPFLLPPEHGFLVILKIAERQRHYFSARDRPKKEDYCLVLPDAIRQTFKALVPPPADFELRPLRDVPAASASCRYACDQKAIADLRLVAEYMAQGLLRHTKSERVSLPSIKALHQLTGGPEFFEGPDDSDLALLRTRLLVGGMAVAGEKVRAQLLARPGRAEPVRDLFEKVVASAPLLHEELLAHLANSENRWCPYNPRAVKELTAFFWRLPAGHWVAWENIRRYHTLREQVPSLFAPATEGLYGKLTTSEDGWSTSMAINKSNTFELVSSPLLKGCAFLLAAFGLAEIAYSPPKHATYRRPKKDYLTPFDGLRFVRLTPLGEFVLGQRKKYAVAEGPRTRAAIILDESRLLATCWNTDALTALALGQLLEKLAPGRYRMTPMSLLGGCRSRDDIEARIQLFRRVVSANPPAIWEEFFELTLARSAPLELEPDYVVLKISTDEEIRRRFASDPALREITLKVEGLRIAVRRTDLKKLAKRLEQLGFLSPLSRLAAGLAAEHGY